MAPMQEFFFGVDWVFWLWMCFWAWILLLDFNRFWQEGSTLYFKSGRDSGWNRFDIVLYVMLAYTFYVAEVVHVDSQRTNEALMENIDTDVFTDLMPLRKKMRDMVQYIALISFLSVVRFLKYLNGIEQVSFIWRVVGSAKLDLLAFTTVFVLLLLGFALLCSTLFGSVEKNFHNIPTALFSLLRMTVGTLDYDYDVMKHQDSTFAPVFLTLFLFTMMLVCVNFFIAILTESFSKKKSQVQKYKEYKRAEKATGITSQKKTTIFPSFTVQEHPAPWPARQSAGLDNPEEWPRSTLKLHEGGEDDGAQIICLHLFKETQQVLRGGVRRTRSPTGANLRGSRKVSARACGCKNEAARELTSQSRLRVLVTFLWGPQLSPRDEYEASVASGSIFRRNADRIVVQDSYIEEIDGVNGRNENELRKHPWAAYLQLRQEFGSATQILFEMRDGEPLTIKEKGSFGKVIKCKVRTPCRIYFQ